MSQDNKKGGICPVPGCGKKAKSLKQHLRVSHPEYNKTESVSTTPQPTTAPTAAPAKPQESKVVKLRSISWWKLALGALAGAAGIYGIIQYAVTMSFMWGGVSVVGIVTGGMFIYYGFFKRGETGYKFVTPGRVYTGKENTIIIEAMWDGDAKLALVKEIYMATFKEDELPAGARMHLVKNLHKHFYEIYNFIDPVKGEVNVNGKPKYVAFVPPDVVMCTPEEYAMTSNMQAVKDYFDFNPPTNFQKIASGILLLAMVVIGILMVMTSGGDPAVATIAGG